MARNTILFKGVRATKNPEKFGNGENYSFGIAEDNGKDKDGNQRPTTFYNVVCFGKTAEFFCKPQEDGQPRIKKGMNLNLEGYVQKTSYTDKEGNKRESLDIVMTYAQPLAYWDAKKTDGTESAPAADEGGFMNVPDMAGDDDCPFN